MRWEYRTVVYSTVPSVNMGDTGGDGWELVSVIHEGEVWYAFFKKPIQGAFDGGS